MDALRDSGVPVIPTRLLCEDPSVIGTAFYVMDFAEGRIFRDPSLPGIAPAERREIYAAMGEVMARLHAVDWRAAGSTISVSRQATSCGRSPCGRGNTKPRRPTPFRPWTN
jgi:aminoglycoside phosphotransferase (APT) family kinase protein